MKVFYYQNPYYENVGDALNKWMWNELLPGFFDQDESTQLVGIGTILNNNIPRAQKTVIFSSGVGYGSGLPNPDKSWHFSCVRGPLSAQKLGLPERTAVTDGAALLSKLRTMPANKTTYRFTYMPHAHFTKGKHWQEVCEAIGFGYIDPRWPFDKVLDELSKTEILMTEAMHGAIIADTMRVPWIPVQSHKIILPFKWLDWTQSLGLEYTPHHITGLVEYPAFTLRWAKYTALGPLCLRKKIAAKQLIQISKTAKPSLSPGKVIESLSNELEERLHTLKSQFTAEKELVLS